MNRWIRQGAAVSAAALMMLITLPALAAEGTVNTGSLVLRKSASRDSQALQTLQKGDTVTVQSQSGDWYKVRYGSYTGYVMKQYLKVTGEVESAEKAASSDALRPGDSGSRVKSLQQSLKELGLTLNDFPYAIEDGIWILEEDCKPGDDINAVALRALRRNIVRAYIKADYDCV